MKAFSILILASICHTCFGQPHIQWEKCFGGTNFDFPSVIKPTTDGGFIFLANTGSNDGDVSGNHGNDDYWVVRLDSIGSIIWQKCFGGSLSDYPKSIICKPDGGFLIAGSTTSNDGDVTNNHAIGFQDIWVISIDEFGILEWQRCYGGSGNDDVITLCNTKDSGYYILGQTLSNDGDVGFNHGDVDIWVINIDSTGLINWEQTLGGSNTELASDIESIENEGSIVLGFTNSTDGDVVGDTLGASGCWLIKLDLNGQINWQVPSGRTDSALYGRFITKQNEKYLVAGNDNSAFISSERMCIVEIDSLGNFYNWHSYPDFNYDIILNHVLITTNGFLFAGTKRSNWGGQRDSYILKIDSGYQVEWDFTLGDSVYDDYLNFSCPTIDSNYLVIGFDGDGCNQTIFPDCWVFKLSPFNTSINKNNLISNFSSWFSSSQSLNIDFVSNKKEEFNLKIFDINGRCVHNQSLTVIQGENEFVTKVEFNKGLYFVLLESANGRISQKIIKD